MTKHQYLPPDEYDLLIETVRQGVSPACEQAKEKLTIAFLPLANKMARKYEGKLGYELAKSAANFGLVMAMRTWNPDKGALPSWIRLYCKSALLRELDRHPTIRLPQDLAAKYAMYQHYKKQGVDPTTKMELTPEMVKDFETVPELGYIEDLFSDIVGQTAASANEDAVLLVEDLLANLPEDDQEVLKARFGIGYDGACHSYEEVAAMLNKPVDEIRTHEVRGLATLRSLSRG